MSAILAPALDRDYTLDDKYTRERGRIYLSEAGGAFQELALGDTTEAQALRQMLAAHPDGVRLGPTILAGSGGCGYNWTPADSADGAAPPPANPPARKS